jgi:ribosomal protein L37E
MSAVDAVDVQSAPPDWENVPFDVTCARCGHDLRWLKEPPCPACGLEFNWADTVPIEQLTCLHCGYHLCGLRDTRCPECGEPFTWSEVLLEYRAAQRPLFEYRWREQPVRSFGRTCFQAMRPGRLWRHIDIHDPPQAVPLIVLVVVMLLLLAVAMPIVGGIAVWLFEWLWWRLQLDFSDLLSNVAMAGMDGASYVPAAVAALWCAMSFAALMVFRQSMRLCKVRTIHVLRVWAYSLPLTLPLLLLCFSALMFVYLLVAVGTRNFGPSGVGTIAAIAVLCAYIVFVVWSLRQGYRWYLRMRHSLGVAVASQVVALLASAITVFWVQYLVSAVW